MNASTKRVLVFGLPLLAFLALAVLFLVRLGDGSDHEALPTALAGQPLPTFRLKTLDDTPITEKDLHGPLLLNVWATWCPSCYEEHPYLLELAKQGVKIVGVNYKDDANAARGYLAERGSPYQTVIADVDGTLGLDLGVYGAPETFVVDAQGLIRKRIVGVITPEKWASDVAPVFGMTAGGAPP